MANELRAALSKYATERERDLTELETAKKELMQAQVRAIFLPLSSFAMDTDCYKDGGEGATDDRGRSAEETGRTRNAHRNVERSAPEHQAAESGRKTTFGVKGRYVQ